MSSLTDFTGRDGLTTRTLGHFTAREIGAKSLMAS